MCTWNRSRLRIRGPRSWGRAVKSVAPLDRAAPRGQNRRGARGAKGPRASHVQRRARVMEIVCEAGRHAVLTGILLAGALLRLQLRCLLLLPLVVLLEELLRLRHIFGVVVAGREEVGRVASLGI